ncbi:uncharacterized protein LOC116431803 isoform X2 [Nomia melanderi]
MILIVLVLTLHNDKCLSTAEPISLFSFIHDLVQSNIAGVPVIHEQTQWDFDPNVGKQRRIRYEKENGRYGEIAIAKIGMGIGYKGPWGTPV